jgi:hypothetical protein
MCHGYPHQLTRRTKAALDYVQTEKKGLRDAQAFALP